MELLLWLVFGGLVGWIASMIIGTDARQGMLGNIIVGMVGAVLGGFVVSLFGGVGVTGINLYSFFVALLGSVIFLWAYRAFTHRRV